MASSNALGFPAYWSFHNRLRDPSAANMAKAANGSSGAGWTVTLAGAGRDIVTSVGHV
jgi:hypothetical protein